MAEHKVGQVIMTIEGFLTLPAGTVLRGPRRGKDQDLDGVLIEVLDQARFVHAGDEQFAKVNGVMQIVQGFEQGWDLPATILYVPHQQETRWLSHTVGDQDGSTRVWFASKMNADSWIAHQSPERLGTPYEYVLVEEKGEQDEGADIESHNPDEGEPGFMGDAYSLGEPIGTCDDQSGELHCLLEKGHDGPHREGPISWTWPNREEESRG